MAKSTRNNQPIGLDSATAQRGRELWRLVVRTLRLSCERRAVPTIVHCDMHLLAKAVMAISNCSTTSKRRGSPFSANVTFPSSLTWIC